MFVNVMLVLDKLVLHLLFQIVALGAQMWQTIHYILDEMKTVLDHFAPAYRRPSVIVPSSL